MGWFRKSRKKLPEPEKEELWAVCPRCAAHIFKQEWRTNLHVCPKCNYHGRINSRERLSLIIDPGSFEELDADVTTADPLAFVDVKGRYAERAEEAKTQTGLKEAILTGRGKIQGTKVVVGIMDFRFMGGSLGSGTGEKILLASEYALRHRLPYIIFSASGGARMQEGIVSLMQMAKTCAGIARLHRAGIPYVSVLTDPTTGGVSASYAMIGDINIAEPGALIGFAGRRVIEQTIKQKLPDDFQTAEYLLEHGFIDRIVNRSEIKGFLHKYLAYSQS
jgi:acetyl-CoA carboxylase carboxyl transferase subunit beta